MPNNGQTINYQDEEPETFNAKLAFHCIT